jgi:hypothetical protein
MSKTNNMRKMINLMETAVGHGHGIRSRADLRRLYEGKMKELWMLIKQGKSAEEIAEILNVDVATIKSLMDEEGLGEDEVPQNLGNINADEYVALYTTIAKIAAESVSDIKRWEAAGDFDETRSWHLAERNMKPILQAIEEVYDINSVLDK